MRAGLEAGILMFNVESEEELDVLAQVAAATGPHGRRRDSREPRRGPEDAPLHHHRQEGDEVRRRPRARCAALARRAHADAHLELRGIQCHIGSQITTVDPFRSAVARTTELALSLRNGDPHARVARHGRRLRHLLQGRGRAAHARLRGGRHACPEGQRAPAHHGARPPDRRQRGRDDHARHVQQALRRPPLRDRRRGHERPAAAEPLRGLPPHVAGLRRADAGAR